MLSNLWLHNTYVQLLWVPPNQHSVILAGREICLLSHCRVVQLQVRIQEKVVMAQLAKGNKSLVSVLGLL